MTQEEIVELFDQYHNMVYRLALTITHSTYDADDVTQTVFLKLINGSPPPQPGKERAWLNKVTVNACHDLLKSFWRRKIEPLEDSISFEEPEEKQLFEAVLALPAKYRTVIHLHYYEGYTGAEIAEILNLKPSTVSMRLHRARNMLRNTLLEDAYGKIL